jgi:hypothetical protein
MTGHAFDFLGEQAPELAACGCLPKPFTTQVLARHVNEALTKT